MKEIHPKGEGRLVKRLRCPSEQKEEQAERRERRRLNLVGLYCSGIIFFFKFWERMLEEIFMGGWGGVNIYGGWGDKLRVSNM